MKSNREPRQRQQEKEPSRSSGDSSGRTGPAKRPAVPGWIYPLAWGSFLGLSILKFGNPVILDQKIIPPADFMEAWRFAWPAHWAYGFLLVFAVISAALTIFFKPHWRGTPWLWILPVTWFGWQLISATRSVDSQLTTMVLWHFGGCLASYCAGTIVFRMRNGMQWLLMGLLTAFALCLVRAIDQRLFEFPQERQVLLEGERTGWTNFPPEILLEMKRDNVVITTNGVDVANPVILAKYSKGRVMGTLVYPNALAGLILLLWPVSVVLAVNQTRRFMAGTRMVAIVMTLFLGGAALFWTGSKLGWLIAVMLAGIWLLRSNKPGRWKYIALTLVTVAGLAVFAVRFHNYFASGATSVGARFDYWRAALRVTAENPLLGSGPGTFQRPYSQIKSPEAEMARLVHNDYLEQFSDSGIPGGIAYLAWILGSLAVSGRRLWKSADALPFAVFIGLAGWFVQGLGEFSLYIPALAWIAFTLLGWLVAGTANQIDKPDGRDYKSRGE